MSQCHAADNVTLLSPTEGRAFLLTLASFVNMVTTEIQRVHLNSSTTPASRWGVYGNWSKAATRVMRCVAAMVRAQVDDDEFASIIAARRRRKASPDDADDGTAAGSVPAPWSPSLIPSSASRV